MSFSINKYLCLALSLALCQHAESRIPQPRVPWRANARFVFEDDLSDEFNGNTLNLSKWDEHGIRNPDTQCPKWNGPPSETFPDHSIFFPATDNPIPGGDPVRMYRLRKGRLEYRVQPKELDFFESREYYCNSTTFTCNHNPNIPCFATNFFGAPLYIDKAKTKYRGISHDKCKISPFCIPHYRYVSGAVNRTYYRHAAPHISSKRTLKYGFLEARVRLPPSSVILAVWMHNDDMVNGYCRYRKMEGPPIRRLECPSLTRSRRWQEIDLLEAMNSDFHKQKFFGNVHAFNMYKGEFSSANAVDLGDGEMGGGNIILRNMFNLKNPAFQDVESSRLVDNDFHWNPGSLHDFDVPWAQKTRTVGVYWSPTEIRFYFDGKEVRRLKNTIIHQPLYLDISTAINVAWAKEVPDPRQMKKYSKIFYIRTWKVFTENGEDPPSDLKVDLAMERKFEPIYGNEMHGAFNRFPHNDDLTDFPTIPDPVESLEEAPLNVTDRQVRDARSVGSHSRGDFSSPFDEQRDYFDTRLARLTRMVQEKNPGFEQAGGVGNTLQTKKRRKMLRQEKRAALADPSRINKLIYDRQGRVKKVLLVDMPEKTCYEFSNPQKTQAGWASEQNGQDRFMKDMDNIA